MEIVRNLRISGTYKSEKVWVGENDTTYHILSIILSVIHSKGAQIKSPTF
jgi:hypothetical protein